MLSLANIVALIIQGVVGVNLLMPMILYLANCLTRMTRREYAVADPGGEAFDYAVIVTAYEETALLPSVVSSLLRLNYNRYIIYVVADNCDISGLAFDDERVIVLRPPTVLASNVKSHFYAIENFIRPHDKLTIIDSDNEVVSDYLNELNVYFRQGFTAVQGQRKAKNLNTTYACLDAARDIYYHFYDAKLLFHLGSSATLAGSGMAFNVEVYKRLLGDYRQKGAGFDKVLQFEIVNDNKRIAYAENAVVYDEKTARSEQLVKQRARWINTWFKYFYFGFVLLYKSIKRWDRNQFLFGLTLVRPPLFIFLLLSFLCLLANALFGGFLIMGIWFLAMIIFVISFFLALYHSETDKRIYKALTGIPKFIFFQIKSLFYAQRANKISVATKHVDRKTESQ